MATENTSMSADELFNGSGDAGADAAPAAVETPAGDTTRDDGRDERGRFQAAIDAADKATAQTVETTVAKAAADDDQGGGQVPAWRLREIADERREIQTRLEAREAELREFRGREAARANREREAQRRQQMPDPYNDAEGYTEFLREDTRSVAQQIREEVRDMRIEDTFGEMHEAHPEEFPKAYQALRAAGQREDPAFERVRNAPNPGKELMRWYRDGEALREIGGDLTGWRSKERERLMKDPEFRKEFAAAMAAEVRGDGGNGNGGDTVVMMPSVNRAAGSRGSPAQGGVRSTEEFTGLFNGNGRKRPA